MLYWPCIVNKHGKVREKLTHNPMSYDDAEEFIKRNYRTAWVASNAIPQPIMHPYFVNEPETIYWILKDEL